MDTKPLKNGKGVSKPFRSPFSTPRNDKSTESTSDASKSEPLKSSSTKRLLLFEEETPPRKRSRPIAENDDDQVAEKKGVLRRSDLESLRERIRRKEESLAALKSSLSYRKKNKAEDLESATKKWTEGCQAALQDCRACLRERNGQNVSMSDVLSSFDIAPDKVRYSVEDDTFSQWKRQYS